jgi:CheY-like chemotaxis protein
LKTVAVLDDDQALVELYQTVLEEEGYIVHPVKLLKQPAQILANIMAINPDVLILDIHIPGLNSFDIIKKLNSHPELSKIKVLVCSASRPSLSSLQGQLSDANLVIPRVLEKPFDLDELSRVVDSMIGLDN